MNTFFHFKNTSALLCLAAGLTFSCHNNKDPEPQSPTGGGDPNGPCTKADATVGHVQFTDLDISAGTYSFTFQVTNKGTGSLPLNHMHYQTFLSSDTVTHQGDIAAGEADFDNAAPTLTTGQSFTASASYVPTAPHDLKVYRFLVIKVQAIAGQTVDECSTANNQVAGRIMLDLPREGLVAFYPFTGNANDLSGNHLDGTTLNGPSLSADRFGNAASCYLFDGVDDVISMGNPTLLQINNKITVSGWFNARAFAQFGQSVINKYYHDPDQGYYAIDGYDLGHNVTGGANPSRYVTVETHASHASGDVTVMYEYVGDPLVVQQWVFFCFVIDGVHWKFYVNGVLKDSGDESVPLLTDGSRGDLCIGAWQDGGFEFNGWIDDVAIYNRALTDAELTQLFHQTITQ